MYVLCNKSVSMFTICISGGLVSAGAGLPTGADTGEVRWWNYLYSTLVCAMCLIVSLVGSAMFGKTTIFIFAVSLQSHVFLGCVSLFIFLRESRFYGSGVLAKV